MTDTKIVHIPMHEILALVENTIAQLSEDDAQEIIDSDYHLMVQQLMAGQPEYIETEWD